MEQKLKTAHPDLPIVIINNLYGGIFADPEYSRGRYGRWQNHHKSSYPRLQACERSETPIHS
ncbi:hypothetical protein GQ44DRAFT_717673 [Phaeosphaeriaceae sp. PMI808]|nr:hypothetical protein GQ44DRAFT_717673 [Phaeosphaeriaceae sp. PMI808]